MEIIKGFPATSQDGYQLNVTQIMEHAVRNFGRQEIVSRRPDGGLFTYTYAQAYERIKRLANGLKNIGVKVGDRVGVLAWNSHENYEIYFGLPGLGAVMLLLNLRLTPQDLAYVMNHSGADFFIADETLLPLAHAVAPLCENLRGVVIITLPGKTLAEVETSLENIYSYEDLLAASSPDMAWPHLDETSAYAACYTTGTTGRPKGVYYSHRDVYLHSCAIGINSDITTRDTYCQIVPMFHALGWGLSQATTMVGARLVFPGMYTLETLDDISRLMVSEKVTISAGAPAIFMPLLEYIRGLEEKPDLSGARLLSGATEPPISMMKGFQELTGAEVIHAYGATETTPLVTINRIMPWLEEELDEPQKWALRRKQGFAVVGLDIRVVNSEGREVPHDGRTPGEILVRGPWITGTYYNAPETADQFTADGYWRSGDVGTMDANGYLKITDRIKDVIKSGGEWISSVDMENEILSHPAVLEAAVVGIPHPRWQERPLALVVLRKEQQGRVTAEDIRAHLLQSFARWQLPDEVRFLEAIPRTSVGKADKKFIRVEYQALYLSADYAEDAGRTPGKI